LKGFSEIKGRKEKEEEKTRPRCFQIATMLVFILRF